MFAARRLSLTEQNMEAHAQLARENTDTLCTQIQRQESSVGDLKAALKSFESDRAVVWEIAQQEAIQQTRQTIAQLEREFAALKELMMFEVCSCPMGDADTADGSQSSRGARRGG
jgi:polyhydroxyalkanoate synthesis regulator phasin